MTMTFNEDGDGAWSDAFKRSARTGRSPYVLNRHRQQERERPIDELTLCEDGVYRPLSLLKRFVGWDRASQRMLFLRRRFVIEEGTDMVAAINAACIGGRMTSASDVEDARDVIEEINFRTRKTWWYGMTLYEAKE